MAPDPKFLKGAFEAVRRMVAVPNDPQIPRYALLERLGEGAMAVVYRAQDRELNRVVALKVLKETVASSEEGRARFRREAQAAAGLAHGNLVTVYDAGEHEGRVYLVMELVDGRSLRDVLRDPAGRRADAVGLVEKVARGVAAAHEKGIVHRDLKPANILVTRDGEPKVADFGLALGVDPGAALTATGTAVGTPLYMAPEQVRGEGKKVGPWTDVYALGAILYEALAGRPPHVGSHVAEIFGKILNDDPPLPRKLDPRIARDVQTVCLKALEKDPARRYPTAKEFGDDLRRHRAGEPILARPTGALERGVRWIRRRPAAAAAGAFALMSALLLSLLVGGRGSEESRVARQLVLQKRQNVEGGIEQWRRQGHDATPFLEVLSEADRRMGEGKLAEAAALLDRAQVTMGLSERVRALRELARAWKQEGRDPTPLLRIADEAERLVPEGKLPEAMMVLDRAGMPLSGGSAFPERIQRKIQRVQDGIERWRRAGRDPAPVGPIMQEFEPLMRAQKPREAEAVLDRALRFLGGE